MMFSWSCLIASLAPATVAQMCHLKKCGRNSVAAISATRDDVTAAKRPPHPLKFTTRPVVTVAILFFQLRTLLRPKAPLQALLQGEKCRIQQQLKTEPAYQLQPSITTPINHCHLAPRQPHASLPAAPSACSPQECWVMRDGEGASRHPVTSHVGKKGRTRREGV